MSDENKNNEIKKTEGKKSNYLGIMFNCCGVYGRIYKNKDQTAYVGHCPKCMRSIRVNIGEGGVSRRFFDAY